MTAQSQIYKLQKDMGYETTLQYVTDMPDWQIDYSRYGDIEKYKIVKNKFWEQAQRFLYKPNTGKIIQTFPIKKSPFGFGSLMKEGEEILFQRFREDLETRLDLPAHLIEKYQK